MILKIFALSAAFTLTLLAWRAYGREDRKRKIALLVVRMRDQWREQQGPIAKHFNDYLPLTNDLVREWFAKRGEKWPRNWELILLEHDATNDAKD